jgi:hypothetical protein
MTAASDYYEDKLLRTTFQNEPYSVAQTYVGLNTADPTDAAADTELTDSGYARVAGAWTVPVLGAGTVSNSADLEFPAIADAGPFSVTHITIWDAPTGGNMLIYAPLTTAKVFSQNDVPRFPIGSLTPKVA